MKATVNLIYWHCDHNSGWKLVLRNDADYPPFTCALVDIIDSFLLPKAETKAAREEYWSQEAAREARVLQKRSVRSKLVLHAPLLLSKLAVPLPQKPLRGPGLLREVCQLRELLTRQQTSLLGSFNVQKVC